MSERIVPIVARVLGVCAFISITMYSVYLNAVPQYVIECTGCAGTDGCCTATEDPNLYGMIEKINWVTLVAYLAMYALLCCAIGIVVERWLVYYYAERQTDGYATKMIAAIASHRIDEARNLAADYPKSPLAAVINASLHPTGICATDDEGPSMEAWHHAMAVKTAELKRGLWELSAAGWTMPLLSGLILVVGIISTLQGMRAAEGTGIASLAGGIARALCATVFSLLFGIPSLWFHKYLNAKCNRLVMEMERRSLAMLSLIARLPETIQASKALRPYDTQPLNLRVTQQLTHS